MQQRNLPGNMANPSFHDATEAGEIILFHHQTTYYVRPTFSPIGTAPSDRMEVKQPGQGATGQKPRVTTFLRDLGKEPYDVSPIAAGNVKAHSPAPAKTGLGAESLQKLKPLHSRRTFLLDLGQEKKDHIELQSTGNGKMGAARATAPSHPSITKTPFQAMHSHAGAATAGAKGESASTVTNSQADICQRLATLGCDVAAPKKHNPPHLNSRKSNIKPLLSPPSTPSLHDAAALQARAPKDAAVASKDGDLAPQAQGNKTGANELEHRPFPVEKHFSAPGKEVCSTRWLRNKDIPKGDPKRYEPKWSSSTSSAQCSGWLNAGADDKDKFAADARSGLADWAGGWQPAPLDWDFRPHQVFRPDQTFEQIDQWLNGVEHGLRLLDRAVSTADGHGFVFAALGVEHKSGIASGNLMGDLAPRYWIPQKIGTMSPALFWKTLIASEELPPHDEGDLDGVTPWWHNYQSHDCAFLKQCEPPFIAGIDPNESTAERLARENDFGGTAAAEKRKLAEKAKRDKKRHSKKARSNAKAREARQRATKEKAEEALFKPGIDMYVRSAKREDMERIRDIYNHYVNYTVVAPELEHQTEHEMTSRWQSVQANKLPFLVACERGTRLKARRGKYGPGEDVVLPDKVVGFAFVHDYHDKTAMYHLTVKMEVYTSNERCRKGIARTLVDKLMTVLDLGHTSQSACEVTGADLDGSMESRAVKSIIVNYPHDAERKEKLEWMARWLGSGYGFKHVGMLESIGRKMGKT